MVTFITIMATIATTFSTPIDVVNQSCNNLTYSQASDTVINYHWENKNAELTDMEQQFFLEHAINDEKAQVASDIYVQEEIVPYEFIESNEVMMTATNEGHINQEDEYLHNKGYIKFITKAYSLGFYDSGIVYYVEVTTEQQKKFKVNQNDNLIIRFGDNAVPLSDDRYVCQGNRHIEGSIEYIYDTADDEVIIIDEELTPNYTYYGGVYYTFKAQEDNRWENAKNVRYDCTTVTGTYYLIATDTTVVLPSYIHNVNWFINSLSFSFGPVGTEIVIEDSHDLMNAQPMTLPGYKDRIQTSVYTVSPADYGFEERYYFEEKTKEHSIGNLNFSTNRLRCGYIEEEYINLSPNRTGAGDAYLEYTFDKPIYEIDAYLSFWSSNENMNYANGDRASIDYLDKDGNWKEAVDLLNCNLSEDRSKQDLFIIRVIEGTTKLRFSAHKENPTTDDRNKGRISIGQIKFVSNYVN